jgi:HAD superfamily hydrolase (TIGR01459 family)
MTDTMTATRPHALSGLNDLADGYDAFILDLWGVLHDGVAAYPDAVDTLKALKARGKRLLVLSNAPRPAEDVRAQMRPKGLTDELYDAVMSSGEDAAQHLRARPDRFYRELGRRLFHIGPERDRGLWSRARVSEVGDPQFADFVLNTGPDDPDAPLERLDPVLRQMADRELPMICANPDLKVMRGAAMELCAGALAARYQEIGGEVRYHGKPHAAIYDPCFKLLGDPDPARTLAVGDTLRTDVAGANAVGLDSVLVTGGIHAEDLGVRMGEAASPEALGRLIAREAITPSYVLPAFRW